MEEAQGKHLMELSRGRGGIYLLAHSLRLALPCFLTQPRTTIPGVALPISWALPHNHQSGNYPHRQAQAAPNFSTEGLLPSYVKETTEANYVIACVFSSKRTGHTGLRAQPAAE